MSGNALKVSAKRREETGLSFEAPHITSIISSPIHWRKSRAIYPTDIFYQLTQKPPPRKEERQDEKLPEGHTQLRYKTTEYRTVLTPNIKPRACMNNLCPSNMHWVC